MTRLEDQLRAALQHEEPPAGFADRVLGLAAERDERRERSLWFQFRSMFAVRRLSWAAAAGRDRGCRQWRRFTNSGRAPRGRRSRQAAGDAGIAYYRRKMASRSQRDQRQNRYPERPVSSRHSPGHGEPGMKRLLLLLISLMLPAIVPAQEIRLPANLEKLSAKAVEVVEVNLDQRMLQLAARFMDPKDPDEQQAKKLIANLKSVYVRSFEFDKAGQYSEADRGRDSRAIAIACVESHRWSTKQARTRECGGLHQVGWKPDYFSRDRCRRSQRAHVCQYRRTDQA